MLRAREMEPGVLRCWAHGLGCSWEECPASDSTIGHECNNAGTGRLGLCPAHEEEMLGT